jgi:NAD(P)-dependent dehydrogenase (short-subunit alcohol dehydrogenase family)
LLKEPSLVGQRVLITAGASGIGLQTARGFLEAGAKVMVCDIDESALKAVRDQFPLIKTIKSDVCSEPDVIDLFSAVDHEFDGLDVLINNVGVAGPTAPIEEIQLSDLLNTLHVNVVGHFLCTKHAIPRLRKGRRPAIVNLSSAAGHLGMPRRSAYSASKWAVIGLTKSLAIELGVDGIRVNAVLPGAVDGPRIRAVIAAKASSMGKTVDDVTADYKKQSSLGRMVTAEEVANTILFACSASASSTHGQSLVVDGHTQALS